jgi:hypothetical protein
LPSNKVILICGKEKSNKSLSLSNKSNSNLYFSKNKKNTKINLEGKLVVSDKNKGDFILDCESKFDFLIFKIYI